MWKILNDNIKDILYDDSISDSDKVNKLKELIDTWISFDKEFNIFWDLVLKFFWSKELYVSKKDLLKHYNLKAKRYWTKTLNEAIVNYLDENKNADKKFLIRPRRFISEELFLKYCDEEYKSWLDTLWKNKNKFIQVWTCSYWNEHIVWQNCNCIF